MNKIEKFIKDSNPADLILRGLKVVEKEKQEAWINFVHEAHKDENIIEIRLAHDVLKVMEALDSGKSLDEVHEIFNSNGGHSGSSFYSTLSGIKEFGDKSNLFLQEYVQMEINGEFNKLSKEEIAKIEESINEKNVQKVDLEKVDEKNLEENFDKVKDVIERGFKVIEPGKEAEWESFVRKNEDGMGFLLVKNTLDVMEGFKEEKSQKEISEIFNEMGHSEFSANWTLTNIEYFSDKTNPEIKEYIEKERNGEFFKDSSFEVGQ